MDKIEIIDRLRTSTAELKDFQRATVDHVFTRLYKEGRKRHLVADEVGLGKTIVAKGVIAMALERHIRKHDARDPFKVVYICSNQSLARQNLRKLNVFKDKSFQDEATSRLVFLAYKEQKTEWFRLGTLTPSTSFQLTQGQGLAEERMLMWYMLSHYNVFTKGSRANGFKLLFQGTVRSSDDWRKKLDAFRAEQHGKLRQGVHTLFKQEVQAMVLDLDKGRYKRVGAELGLSGARSMQDVLVAYAEKLRANNLHNYTGYGRLVAEMRKILTKVCVDFLDADLFILDEFQRFKDLVDLSSVEPSDAAVIARKIFSTKGSKVLLLSATPFKPFTTGQEEQELGEVHHKEFEQVLDFLHYGNAFKTENYRTCRKRFHELMKNAVEGDMEDHGVKQELEAMYREVMSRTERLLVSDDRNTLVKTVTDDRSALLEADIWDFVRTDRMVQTLKEETGHAMHAGVDFSRSSSSPFSFLDQYQVKQFLAANKGNERVRTAITQNAKGWLDLKKVERYGDLDPIPNNKMRLLMDQVFPTGMERMLWLPPTMPYYALGGAFRSAKDASKVLLFSRWRMVPRAVASLVSYNAERTTIGNPKLRKDLRHYWPRHREGAERADPKKPTPRLTLKLKGRETASSMSAFALLYPSMTLAQVTDLQNNVRTNSTVDLATIRAGIKKDLARLIDEAGLRDRCKGERETANWYWAAPVLLDKFHHPQVVGTWFKKKQFWSSSFIKRKGHESEGDSLGHGRLSKSHVVHMETLRDMFDGELDGQLGRFPADLFDVLVDMALASPAVCSYRLVNKLFPEAAGLERLNASLDLAGEFMNLFDKPTSICIVDLNAMERGRRRTSSDNVYWSDVLDYCMDGNIQSMLDEFGHLIRNDHDELETFKERVATSVNMRTSSIDVDDAAGFLEGTKKKMRCHFALEFGGRSFDSESGQERAGNVLDNFNSPFWPFVLASTSVGQEGLDFHLYCRKVVHWNLPSNAIDLEQREGRVNRYKGLVIRQNLMKKYGSMLQGNDPDPWEELFRIARKLEGSDKSKSELVPYWHVEAAEEGGVHIERIHPLLPYSRDIARLDHLLWVLTLYRLTLGQPRQEELLKTVFKNVAPERLAFIRKELMIDLCPLTFALQKPIVNV